MFQDSQGFLWIGTADGLNKFDGYRFAKFNSTPIDSFSLSGNDISCIYENPNDSTLWIGTQNAGLNIYNSEHDNFHSFSKNPKKTGALPSNAIRDLLSTGKTLWIATMNGGICYFNSHDSTFTKAPFSNIDAFKTVNSLEKDKDGNLWIGTPNGLYKWRYANRFNNELPQKIVLPGIEQETTISALHFDIKGNLWIGTINNGLIQYHPKSENTTHFRPGHIENNISAGRIFAILERKNGEIWAGTASGLCKYLPKTKNFEIFRNEPSNPESLNNNRIYSLLEDHSGIIWVGTYLGGLNKIDPMQSRFPKFNSFWKLKGGNKSSNDIRSITVDNTNTIWAGTSSGLVEMKNKNTITDQSETNSKIHFKDKPVGAIISFRDGIIFSSENKIQIKTSTDKIISLSSIIQNQTKRYVGQFSSAMIDEFNQVWLGTNQGLIKYLPEQNKVEIFNPRGANNEAITFRPLSIKEDNTGNIWIGTFDGKLYSFDKYSNKFELVLSGNTDNKLVSFTKIFSLCTAIPNELWIGTNLGLYQFIPETGTINQYITANGLANNIVYGAIADNIGNIWCSTNLGISKLDINTGKFQNYTYQDGLQSNEFNQGAFFKDTEGAIYFGGINGLNIFDPEQITPNRFLPPVVITALEIQYKSITPKSHPEILENHISETKQLVLDHNQNTFSFEFTALSFSIPERNKYQYSLSKKGKPDQWINSGNRRFATYTNVYPGHYVFKVKGSNSDEVWNETPASIEIIIKPPYWQTWWFRIFLFMLLSLIIYLVIYIRLRNLHSQKKLLQKRVEAKTNRVSKQKEQIENQNRELIEINEKTKEQNENIKQKNKLLNEQHEQISKQRDDLIRMADQMEETNQAKFRFFTSISHELRTPLTLIISPLKEMISNIENLSTKELQRKFSIVYGNASKLLLTVNQLLDYRKMETDNMTMHVSKFDFVSFVQKTAFFFNDLATREKYQFTFLSDYDNLKIWADKEKLEKVIYNLLSNAFKHTPKEGKVNIRLSSVLDNERGKLAIITVSDNGEGMHEEKIPLIFERFYQLEQTGKSYQTGSGLGLAIAKKYIELHNGTINVESTKGLGSTFTVQIPVGKKHFGENINFEDQANDETELLISSIGEYSPLNVNGINTSEDRVKPLVLLIEDDKSLRLYLKEILSEQYRIEDTNSAKEAKKLAVSKHPDIIICDVMLKDIDGFEFCRHIKHEFSTSHIPVILLSALADNESNINGLKAGVDAYITKPFDLQHLILNIENLIDGRRRLHKKFNGSDSSGETDKVIVSSDQLFLDEAIRSVENNLNNSDFNVEMFCAVLNLSQPQVYRKIKALTELNISEFIRNIRLKKAAQLLRAGNHKINEVAYETGFNDPNYFTKSFIKLYGMTPTEYGKSF